MFIQRGASLQSKCVKSDFFGCFKQNVLILKLNQSAIPNECFHRRVACFYSFNFKQSDWSFQPIENKVLMIMKLSKLVQTRYRLKPIFCSTISKLYDKSKTKHDDCIKNIFINHLIWLARFWARDTCLIFYRGTKQQQQFVWIQIGILVWVFF